MRSWARIDVGRTTLSPHSTEQIIVLQLLTPSFSPHKERIHMAGYISGSFRHSLVLSSRTRTEILRSRIFHEVVSKRRVATSSILTPSVYHLRKNTFQDNTSRASRTSLETSKLRIHSTEKASIPKTPTMAPKQKIIIDTDPVCHFTNFNHQHPDQHMS